MVEVHVRQEQVVDVSRIDIPLAQGSEQEGDAVVGTGIDEGGTPPGNDQVARIEPWPHVLGVYGDDAVAHACGLCHRLRHRVSLGR